MSEPIKKYRPSNGCAMMDFIGEFCDRCVCQNICRIAAKTMTLDVDDPDYPDAWRYVDGEPVCVKFKDRAQRKPRRERVFPGQTQMELEATNG